VRGRSSHPPTRRSQGNPATAHLERPFVTPQFVALAEKVSGQDLTQFFKVCILQAEKPAPGSW
jgi:predicted metalloprotease with PDZ domain